MGLSLDIFRRKDENRDYALGLNEYANLLNSFTFQGIQYTLPSAQVEEIGYDYVGLARAAYKSNGIVFSCMMVRQLLFSEARFQFRQLQSGRPGKLFGNQDLRVLEQPWPGGTTGDLLSKIIQHADLAGNAFTARLRDRLTCLRPDWVDIVIGSSTNADAVAWDPDSEVLGYIYYPGGRYSGRPQWNFLAEEVAHFAPIPDPEARFRGMSWITPVAREVMADKATTQHKLSTFENGATPNLIVKVNVENLEKWRAWVEEFRDQHEGIRNMGKTLFLTGAMDPTVVGANFQELEFKATQGAGETRIAAAAGVPPIIAGFSEGLQSATYSNYGQARRRFADGTMRPLWRNVAGSLARIVTVPPGSELWYDDRDIPFLQEDQKDAAEVMQMEAAAMKSFVDAGYEPDSVRDAVVAGDLNLLQHSGLVSVQLLPPGTVANNGTSNNTAIPATNGTKSETGLELLLARANQKTEAPDVHVHFEEGSFQVRESRTVRKKVEFDDGRVAVVTEEDE
jgi:HK97 family phage portal protein